MGPSLFTYKRATVHLDLGGESWAQMIHQSHQTMPIPSMVKGSLLHGRKFIDRDRCSSIHIKDSSLLLRRVIVSRGTFIHNLNGENRKRKHVNRHKKTSASFRQHHITFITMYLGFERNLQAKFSR